MTVKKNTSKNRSNNPNETPPKETNIYDVIINLENGIFNLFKFEKIVSIIILYIIFRDIFFLTRIKPELDIQKYLIDTNIINKIFQTDNNIIMLLSCCVVVLSFVVAALIFIIHKVYKPEIDRLAAERDHIMYENLQGNCEPLKNRKTSSNIS